MANRPKAKGRNDAPGGFAGIPRMVLEHPDYIGLSYKAKALLLELAYQYRGNNNGDLTTAFSILKDRGWKREATVCAAVDELIKTNLVVRSREGRFSNPGARCALYALTWQRMDDIKGKGLDLPPSITPLRKFSMEAKPINKTPITQSVTSGYS